MVFRITVVFLCVTWVNHGRRVYSDSHRSRRSPSVSDKQILQDNIANLGKGNESGNVRASHPLQSLAAVFTPGAAFTPSSARSHFGIGTLALSQLHLRVPDRLHRQPPNVQLAATIDEHVDEPDIKILKPNPRYKPEGRKRLKRMFRKTFENKRQTVSASGASAVKNSASTQDLERMPEHRPTDSRRSGVKQFLLRIFRRKQLAVKKQESAGLSKAEKDELEKLKQAIRKRKAELKEQGMPSAHCNKDNQVIAWVKRMQELKVKEDPSLADAGKKSKKNAALERRQQAWRAARAAEAKKQEANEKGQEASERSHEKEHRVPSRLRLRVNHLLDRICAWKRLGSVSQEDEQLVQDSASRLPQSLKALAEEICAAEDGKARLRALVHLGDEWARAVEEGLGPDSEVQRVPGCLANVHIGVDTENGVLTGLHGTADARVSRGLVALLANGLKGMKIEEILGIDRQDLCRELAVYNLVAPSRALGFESMVEVIQQQLHKKESVTHSSSMPPELLRETWSGTGGGEEVAVLLSGGVDSSVALQLAKESGMKPRAFYLRIWLEDELSDLNECPWQEDWEFASATAESVGVPLEAVSMQDAYRERVIEEVLKEARAGRTPNPDILCNRRVKFGMFYDQVGKHFDKIITGHYARIEPVEGEEGEVGLFRSPDKTKDQTYFLSSLTQEQLRKAAFPVGEFQKTKVRELASKFKLPTRARKDSQGLCFLGKLKWPEFLKRYLGEAVGEIRLLETGEVVGEHRGLYCHTLGQRKGIGPLIWAEDTGPYFVAAKDVERNVLYITNNYDAVVGPRCKFSVDHVSWISGRPPDGLSKPGGRLEFDVQVRHGHGDIPGHSGLEGAVHYDAAVVRSIKEQGVYHIKLKSLDQTGLAPGQYAAFYRGDRCFGSGIIRSRSLEEYEVPHHSTTLDAC